MREASRPAHVDMDGFRYCEFCSSAVVNAALQVFEGIVESRAGAVAFGGLKKSPRLVTEGRPMKRALPAELVPTCMSSL